MFLGGMARPGANASSASSSAAAVAAMIDRALICGFCQLRYRVMCRRHFVKRTSLKRRATLPAPRHGRSGRSIQRVAARQASGVGMPAADSFARW
jgi:hypothetical protein